VVVSWVVRIQDDTGRPSMPGRVKDDETNGLCGVSECQGRVAGLEGVDHRATQIFDKFRQPATVGPAMMHLHILIEDHVDSTKEGAPPSVNDSGESCSAGAA
jgi:hypothetical protein